MFVGVPQGSCISCLLAIISARAEKREVKTVKRPEMACGSPPVGGEVVSFRNRVMSAGDSTGPLL